MAICKSKDLLIRAITSFQVSVDFFGYDNKIQ